MERANLQLSSGSRVLVRSRLQGAEKLEGREPMGKLAFQTEKGLSESENQTEVLGGNREESSPKKEGIPVSPPQRGQRVQNGVGGLHRNR